MVAQDESAPALIYRSLGLITNPFGVWAPDKNDAPKVALTTHAAANRLYSALLAAAAEERPMPVWVDKPVDVSPFLAVLVTAEILETLTSDDSFGVIPAYAQLQAMKRGRVRGALLVVAEKIAGAHFDRTLAAWTRHVLLEPDTSLAEWETLEGKSLGRLLDALEVDPGEAAKELYGPLKPEREGVREDLEVLMRVSEARQERNEADPEEEEDAAEDDVDDPAREIFTQPLGESSASTLEDMHPVGDADGPAAADVVRYVVAHTKEHLSPVVARGILAYVAQGTSSTAQEFRVTKAPRKTLNALARFASARFRKVALIWDRLDGWMDIEPDMRIKIAAALAEMRWGLADNGVLVIMSEPGATPELEEQFASATRVSWDMPDLDVLEAPDPAYDEDLVGVWLASAALPGARVWTPADEPFATLAGECGDSLDRFAAAAAAAVESAARRAASEFDDEDLAAGRAVLEAAGGA